MRKGRRDGVLGQFESVLKGRGFSRAVSASNQSRLQPLGGCVFQTDPPRETGVLSSRRAPRPVTTPQRDSERRLVLARVRGFRALCLLFFFVAEIEAEVRLAARARDLERNFGAGAAFMEKRVDRLQQN